MMLDQEIFNTPAMRLKILRQSLEIKQKTFAELLGITSVTLRKYENHGYSLSEKLRDRFRYVGIQAQWLEYGTGEPFDYNLPTVREKIMFALRKKEIKK